MIADRIGVIVQESIFDNAEQEMAFRKALIDQLLPGLTYEDPIIAPDDDGLDHTGSPRNELPDDEPEPDKNRDQLTDPPSGHVRL